jgi:hypothetical protein
MYDTPRTIEDWPRTAKVTGAGKPRERSVYTYALWLANDERSHFKQIELLVNAILRLQKPAFGRAALREQQELGK